MTSRADEVLAEFKGDARAAIAALLEDRDALLHQADSATSHGFLRGRFSEGARRPINEEIA
ncbi:MULTISPECIES: hypothetical protein [unclassified Bosea (in: a-proteobacteria)]|uniref:hypothetical protein n=1 Tax=unclassified Bosea (in: a-proteobacteria) TaxID=2653178 RepID=UPI001F2FDA4D|nr:MULTISPECIES: hypothetical protein [unclassified Bosea (in: a-proteobacteria)]